MLLNVFFIAFSDMAVFSCYFVLVLLSVVGGPCKQPKWDVPRVSSIPASDVGEVLCYTADMSIELLISLILQKLQAYSKQV
jgi:hypothetical protein